MPAIGVWFGLILLAVLVLVAQQYFYAQYRRKHGVLRPLRQRWMGANAEERSEMRGATFRRDDDPAVERARRLYLGAFALVAIIAIYVVMSGSLWVR